MTSTGEFKNRRPFGWGRSGDNGAAIPDPFESAGSRARKRGTEMQDDLIADAGP